MVIFHDFPVLKLLVYQRGMLNYQRVPLTFTFWRAFLAIGSTAGGESALPPDRSGMGKRAAFQSDARHARRTPKEPRNQGTNGFFVPQNGQPQKMANGWHCEGLVQKITCTPKWWNNHHIKSLVNCAEIGYSLTFQLPAEIGNFVRLTLEVCSWFYSPAVYAACTYCYMFDYTIGYSTCI